MAQPEKEPTERVKRLSLPDDVEERTERIIPEEVLAAPEDFREIGQPEVTEIIDLEPAPGKSCTTFKPHRVLTTLVWC